MATSEAPPGHEASLKILARRHCALNALYSLRHVQNGPSATGNNERKPVISRIDSTLEVHPMATATLCCTVGPVVVSV